MKCLSDWRFDGYLCHGDADRGAMWECPLLIRLDAYRPTHLTTSERSGSSLPMRIALRNDEHDMEVPEPIDDLDERFLPCSPFESFSWFQVLLFLLYFSRRSRKPQLLLSWLRR